MLHVVLLSGGSGKRLWPLSNEIRSKIFLKLLAAEDGQKESMIQRICRQLDSVGLLHSTFIVTHQIQAEITQKHVGDSIPIISEPYKRGTFSAIALAASYFHSKLNVSLDEPICILPVDSFVDASFFQILHKFPEMLSQSHADLALLGTVPRYPSNQFGYIVPRFNNATDYYSIASFVEKPDVKKASRLIKKQALWNCGVFAFSLKFMLSYLQTKGLPVDYEDLLNCYENLPEQSFDHEVAEKTSHSIVVPYHGAWKDLGSWDTLTNHLDNNVIGYGQVSEDCLNTHLVNELPYPIQVIDVSHVIVAASPDGILVASKNKSNQIKEKLNFFKQKPMFEEKGWGTYRVLDYSKSGTETEPEMETLTKKMELLPGKHIHYHMHLKRNKTWTIISGSGEFIFEDTISAVKPGDVFQIPSGAKHGVRAVTALEFIEVQIGSQLFEDDSVSIDRAW
ncbi:sugar phosphate nucleotidyltransferase [Paenibacillus eucommiae]|uniref:Mannose-1-phosphate guanylyltransferase n=1 Tax=Paenibacillus eucommiae TaxID=1355755 RepID=A0ABS4J633_9BACL|nr:sugar phosphate nucleotidyltransferase [Paenibacillus eucommiae]MBP1995304.1 mannose-1-phosphate guanylyltransferase [Paenibacillus eucommiae]